MKPLKTALAVTTLVVGVAALALVAWFTDPRPYTPICPRCDVRHAFSDNGCFV